MTESAKPDAFTLGATAFFSGADLTEASASMREAVNKRLQDSQKLGFTEPERHRGSPEFKVFDEWKLGWDYAKKWKAMFDLMTEAKKGKKKSRR